VNAVTHSLLAGSVFEAQRTRVLMALDMYPGETFLLLLKASSRTFRYHGLYALDLKTGIALRMLGRGPESLDDTMVTKFFKFSTKNKTMEAVPGLKSFTRMVAAVKLHKKHYQAAKTIVPEVTGEL